jgi:hypothetical protein
MPPPRSREDDRPIVVVLGDEQSLIAVERLLRSAGASVLRRSPAVPTTAAPACAAGCDAAAFITATAQRLGHVDALVLGVDPRRSRSEHPTRNAADAFDRVTRDSITAMIAALHAMPPRGGAIVVAAPDASADLLPAERAALLTLAAAMDFVKEQPIAQLVAIHLAAGQDGRELAALVEEGLRGTPSTEPRRARPCQHRSIPATIT